MPAAVLLSFAVAFLLGGCGQTATSDATVIKIVATGNVRGEIEPCGCRVPLGGLARKATYVRSLERSTEPYLVVDAGDLFFSKARLSEEDLAKEMIRARTQVQGFNRIGTTAIALGENDLAAGLPFLQALAASADFPFLSANLTDEHGRLLFAPSTVISRGGLNIGLVGASSVAMTGEGYRTAEWFAALAKAVRELRSRSDLLVLLFHGPDRDRQKIMKSGLPIHLIVQSHVTRFEPNFGRGQIPTASLGTQGKYLNVITATIQAVGEPLTDLSVPRRTLRFVESSLQRLRRNQPKDVPLEQLYADNPGVLERISDLGARGAKAREAIAAATNTVETETISLGPSVNNDRELLSLVAVAKQAIAALPVPAGSPADATSL